MGPPGQRLMQLRWAAWLVAMSAFYLLLLVALSWLLFTCVRLQLLQWSGKGFPPEASRGRLVPHFLVDFLYILSLLAVHVFYLKCIPAVYAMTMAFWLPLRRGVGWLWDKVTVAQAAARGSAVPPGAAGPDPDPAVGAQLIAVTPMLLSRLSQAERLALHQASKQLAQEVWRCSPVIKLSLADSSHLRRWTMQLQLPGASRLSPSPVAHLIKSSRPSFLPEPAFLQSIQFLSLNGMQLDASSRASLQALLPNLKHLALVTCRYKPAMGTGAPGQAPLRLHSFSSWESKAAGLVDRQHLQCLDVGAPRISPVLDLSQFPALCVLRISSGSVDDAQLDALLRSKPHMREMCLSQLQLSSDHFAQACSWGLLRLQGDPHSRPSGLFALELAALPLEGIRRLVVERELYAWSNGVAIDALQHGNMWSTAGPRLAAAAERMEFEPGITGWGHLWSWSTDDSSQVDLGLEDGEPGFTLHLQHSTRRLFQTPPEARALAAVVASRLQGGTFVYSGCDLSDPAAALASLQLLPSSVHSLVLRGCLHIPKDPRLLFAHLPLHVQRLVVKAEHVLSVHPKLTRREYRRQQPAVGSEQAARAAAQQ